MKKIKVKVKTLIILLVSLFLIFNYIIPIAMLEIAKKVDSNDREKAIKFYNIYYYTAFLNPRDEALYNLATLMVPSIDTYDIYMSMRGGDGSNVTKDRAEKAVECYKKILDRYDKGKYYDKSYKGLLDIYTGLGDIQKSYELMDWGSKSSNEEIKYISNLYRAFYYFADKDYDKGLEIIDGYIDEGKENRELYTLKGHIYFAKEEYDKAYEFYKLEEDKPLAYGDNVDLFGNIKKHSRRLWLDDFLKYKGDYKIRGKVILNGKGMPFAQIYVRDISGIYRRSPDVEFVAITDSNGEFETVGFKEGQYEIGIGVTQPLVYDMVYMEKDIRKLDLYGDMVYDFQFTSPMEIVSPKGKYILKDDEFDIKWEEVKGAEYYRVQAVSFSDPIKMDGCSTIFEIPNKYGETEIKGNNTRFNLDILNTAIRGAFYFDEDMIVSPQSILGTFYPQSNVPIIINAYDKYDNLINSTQPIISFYDDIATIKVDDRQLTEGENLILHKKYDEAVAYYEDVIKKNDENIEALRYLSKLYTSGWKKGTQDFQKGEDYSFKLYDLTKNKYVIKNLLTSAFMDDDKDEYLKIGERVFELIPEEDLDEELLQDKGNYYLRKGDFIKARQYYERTGKYYLNENIIYIDLYYGEFDKALDRLKDEDFKFWFMSKRNLSIGIEGLKDIGKNSKEWMDFKEFLNKSIISKSRKEDFNKIYKDTKNLSIKIILKEIGSNNRWL